MEVFFIGQVFPEDRQFPRLVFSDVSNTRIQQSKAILANQVLIVLRVEDTRLIAELTKDIDPRTVRQRYLVSGVEVQRNFRRVIQAVARQINTCGITEGGDKLIINGNYFTIFCMSASVSIAAICFALFIANVSNTTEEATSIGGISNIILAALGGIMVPKFVMPAFMQDITQYSPMSWALEGFLDIFVTGGGLMDIKHYIFYLLLFALCSLLFAYSLLIKKETQQ